MRPGDASDISWTIAAAFWGCSAVYTLFNTDGVAATAACIAAAQTALILGGWGVRR